MKENEVHKRAFRGENLLHSATTMNRGEPRTYGFEHLLNDDSLTERKPLRLLFLLYRQHWYQLLLSIVFFLIKHSPIYILPIVTANLINMVANPDKYGMATLWWNIGILAVVIVQNIPTQVLHEQGDSIRRGGA